MDLNDETKPERGIWMTRLKCFDDETMHERWQIQTRKADRTDSLKYYSSWMPMSSSLLPSTVSSAATLLKDPARGSACTATDLGCTFTKSPKLFFTLVHFFASSTEFFLCVDEGIWIFLYRKQPASNTKEHAHNS